MHSQHAIIQFLLQRRKHTLPFHFSPHTTVYVSNKMINGLYKHEVAVKIKEVNGEISGKMIWWGEGRGAPPGVSTHPYLLHFQLNKSSRCGERLIGLDPPQQWLIRSTCMYMSQMVGFQYGWCRKSTQEYWSFLLPAWSPQEVNIRTNPEGKQRRRTNPSLGWT